MYCKNCGNRIPDESKFCPFCMNQFENKKVKSNGKTALVIVAIVAVLLIAAGAVYTAVQPKDNKRTSANVKPSLETSSTSDTSTSSSTTATTTTTKRVVSKNEVYSAYREKIKDPFATVESYFLYDMDNDGIDELIIREGNCEANYVFCFYTYDNKVKFLGQEDGGHSGLAIPKSGGGLIVYWERQGESCVTQFTKQGNSLNVDRIISGEYGSYFDLYCSDALAQSNELD